MAALANRLAKVTPQGNWIGRSITLSLVEDKLTGLALLDRIPFVVEKGNPTHVTVSGLLGTSVSILLLQSVTTDIPSWRYGEAAFRDRCHDDLL
jgi:hypothetical protein